MSLPRYPQYKDSGVEWLGAVPAHWDEKRLRVVAELNPSKSEIAALERGTEVSFLPMEAIGDDGSINLEKTRPIREVETGYTYFRDGDVTVAKITPCFENGKGAIMHGLLGGVGFGTTELIVVRPNYWHITSEYLNWIFCSPNFRKHGEASMYGAGGQKRVPDDFVRNFSWAFPPLPEQTAIATFLDHETTKIDALIAEQEKLIVLLAEKRQAVISHAVTKGLNPDTTMKDSGVAWLGEVPEHWTVCAMRRVLDQVEQGWSPECHNREAEEEEWGVLKAGCVNRGRYNIHENKALPPDLEPIQAYEVRPGDLLMSRASGSPQLVGSVAYVRETRPRLMLSDKIFRLKLSSAVQSEFVAWLYNSVLLRTQIEQAISGADGLANNLPQASMKSFLITVPPLNEQTAIATFLDAETAKLDTLTTKATRAIELLKERRSALISAAVTGKSDVRHWQAEPGAA